MDDIIKLIEFFKYSDKNASIKGKSMSRRERYDGKRDRIKAYKGSS